MIKNVNKINVDLISKGFRSVFRYACNPSGLKSIFAFKTSLQDIIKLLTVGIYLSAPVIEQVASFNTFRTVGINVFGTISVRPESRENAFIFKENMSSDALVTVTGFSIIDFAFDVTWVALAAFDVVSSGAFDANGDGLVVLRTVMNFLDADFGFGQNVAIRTCETETSLRVEGFALVRSVVGLAVSVVVDKISRCALDAIAEIW